MTRRSLGFLIAFISIHLISCKEKHNTSPNQAPSNSAQAAAKEPTITINLDKSPLDMTYFPEEYPKLKMSGEAKEPIVARIIYSRPKKDGRTIFGTVVKYGSRWRLGANEASEIEFFKDVTIQNNRIRKDKYIIYCIPYADRWTIIFNNDLFTWGLKIDSTKDVYKFDVPVTKSQYPLEYFTMEFKKQDSGLNLVMAWDTVKASLPISY